MAALSARSEAALARLRSYMPPPTSWYNLPLTRRAAVLILLYADRKGELRVVLTMRASTLSSYAGQAALPGGKTDSLLETPWITARREASEEIGLPMPIFPVDATTPLPSQPAVNAVGDVNADPASNLSKSSTSIDSVLGSGLMPYMPQASPPTPHLPPPFRVEHLTELPANLARTELGVRPCVAFLSSTPSRSSSNRSPATSATAYAETMLIPRLDPKEVAAVFSAPLHNFLRAADELPINNLSMSESRAWLAEEQRLAASAASAYAAAAFSSTAASPAEVAAAQGASPPLWYTGQWMQWNRRRWRMHSFYVPVEGQVVTRPRLERSGPPPSEPLPSPAGLVPDSTSAQPTTSPPPAKRPRRTSFFNPFNRSHPRPSRTLPYRDVPTPHDPNSLEQLQRYRVFGMTARILVDCARVAYGEDPEFEHNTGFGDEEMIRILLKGGTGRLSRERERSGPKSAEGPDTTAVANDAAAAAAAAAAAGIAQGKARELKGKGQGKL